MYTTLYVPFYQIIAKILDKKNKGKELKQLINEVYSST